MIEAQARLVVDCRNALGEMPVWCAASRTLYWVDVLAPGRVFHWGTDGGSVDFWEFEGLVTGVNLVAGGGLLVHGKDTIFLFDPRTRESQQIFALPPSEAGMRLNDGHCDRAGRLWVGSMPNNISDEGTPRAITEYNGRIHAIGGQTSRSFEANLGCPNAICWSPDGLVFYIADSYDGWLYAYRFDGDSGTISERRRFSYHEGLGIPDGTAVDQEGYLWNARWGAGVVARIDPGGGLDRVIRLPAVSQPTACCFGDTDRRTLYVTSARFGMSPDTLRSEPNSGGVFSIRVDVPGIEVWPFDASAFKFPFTGTK
jgi:sugar lactone lactonase YvrE